MNTAIPVIGALLAAAITPGPNNFIVMQAGARGGIAAASAAVLGIVGGSIALLMLVSIGLGSVLRAVPRFEFALNIAAAAYLAWLGLSLLIRGGAVAPLGALPSTILGVAAFQLFNPKAWVLIATAAGAASEVGGLAALTLLMVLVTSTCSILWALAGAMAARLVSSPRTRNTIERSMGAVLALSAARMLIDALARQAA